MSKRFTPQDLEFDNDGEGVFVSFEKVKAPAGSCLDFWSIHLNADYGYVGDVVCLLVVDSYDEDDRRFTLYNDGSISGLTYIGTYDSWEEAQHAIINEALNEYNAGL